MLMVRAEEEGKCDSKAKVQVVNTASRATPDILDSRCCEAYMALSPTHSSFELLDPHDPVLSRLATFLFKRTNDYLQGEMSAGQDHYVLLEEINRLAITKYTDLRNLVLNLNKALSEYNELYESTIKPLLMQIDKIDRMVSKVEANAYRLDGYTKTLKSRIKEMEDN